MATRRDATQRILGDGDSRSPLQRDTESTAARLFSNRHAVRAYIATARKGRLVPDTDARVSSFALFFFFFSFPLMLSFRASIVPQLPESYMSMSAVIYVRDVL